MIKRPNKETARPNKEIARRSGRLSSDKVRQTNQLSNRLLAGRPDFDSRNRWEMIYVSMSKLAPVPSRFLNGCSHGVVTLELGTRSLTLVAYLLLMLKARMHAALPPGPLGSFRNVFSRPKSYLLIIIFLFRLGAPMKRPSWSSSGPSGEVQSGTAPVSTSNQFYP